MGLSLPNHSESRLWNETEVHGRSQNARKLRVEQCSTRKLLFDPLLIRERDLR